jgi:hypothetical protein
MQHNMQAWLQLGWQPYLPVQGGGMGGSNWHLSRKWWVGQMICEVLEPVCTIAAHCAIYPSASGH